MNQQSAQVLVWYGLFCAATWFDSERCQNSPEIEKCGVNYCGHQPIVLHKPNGLATFTWWLNHDFIIALALEFTISPWKITSNLHVYIILLKNRIKPPWNPHVYINPLKITMKSHQTPMFAWFQWKPQWNQHEIHVFFLIPLKTTMKSPCCIWYHWTIPWNHIKSPCSI